MSQFDTIRDEYGYNKQFATLGEDELRVILINYINKQPEFKKHELIALIGQIFNTFATKVATQYSCSEIDHLIKDIEDLTNMEIDAGELPAHLRRQAL